MSAASFPPSVFPSDLIFTFGRLEKKGFTVYLVGSAVGDLVRTGTLAETRRFDLFVSGGSVAQLESVLKSKGGDKTFFSPFNRTGSGISLETKNNDGETVHKLFIRFIRDSLNDELRAREVRINAIALTTEGEIVDPFDGIQDIEDEVLRPIQDERDYFHQRPLNIIKMARNIAYHGYYPQNSVLSAASREADRLLDMPAQRWTGDFQRMLMNRHPNMGLRFLHESGALTYVLPELEQLVGFHLTCEVHHKDIWEHTLTVVKQAKPTPALRWAALLHDLGKFWTRSVGPGKSVHFFRHENMSANIAIGILARFGVDTRLSNRIIYLVANHSRITLYTNEWTESAVRRLISDCGENLSDMLAMARADVTSKRDFKVQEIRRLTGYLEERISYVIEKDSKIPALPKGIGNEIMKHFNLDAGRMIGALRDALEQAVEDGRLERDLPVSEYMAWLEEELKRQS